MFDMTKIGRKIKEERMKKDLTQMELSDLLGVSYQAVSGWERGNSMPDISRIGEIARIFEISLEELMGAESEETKTTKKIMEGKEDEVSLTELSMVAPVVKPKSIKKITEKVKYGEGDGEKPDMDVLVRLAPFLEQKELDSLVKGMEIMEVKNLTPLAPFLSEEALSELIESLIGEETVKMKEIAFLLPFLEEDTVEKLADFVKKRGTFEELPILAPFMKGGSPAGRFKEGFSFSKRKKEREQADSAEEEAPREDAELLLEYMDEEEVAKLAFLAAEEGEPLEAFLEYMDEEDVVRLAESVLKKGGDAEALLEHMEEEEILKLYLRRYHKKH